MVVEIMQYPLNDIIEILPGKITENACKYLLNESLKGLFALHKRDIIHRDIKSDNILINEKGDVKLADFGLSAQLTKEHKVRFTEKGTPHWTAPEVIKGQAYD